MPKRSALLATILALATGCVAPAPDPSYRIPILPPMRSPPADVIESFKATGGSTIAVDLSGLPRAPGCAGPNCWVLPPCPPYPQPCDRNLISRAELRKLSAAYDWWKARDDVGFDFRLYVTHGYSANDERGLLFETVGDVCAELVGLGYPSPLLDCRTVLYPVTYDQGPDRVEIKLYLYD